MQLIFLVLPLIAATKACNILGLVFGERDVLMSGFNIKSLSRVQVCSPRGPQLSSEHQPPVRICEERQELRGVQAGPGLRPLVAATPSQSH